MYIYYPVYRRNGFIVIGALGHIQLQNSTLLAFIWCVVDKMFIEESSFLEISLALKNSWFRSCSNYQKVEQKS